MGGERALRGPLTLAVLGLLAEEPRHPYEMRALIRERAVDRAVRVRGGSLYDAVARLERAGLIRARERERQGARPERTVYELTAEGRAEIADLLREYLAEPVNEFPRFVAGLAHVVALSPTEAADLLRRRAAALEDEVRKTDEELARHAAGVPRVVLLEAEYPQVVRRAEIDWLHGVAAEMESGALPWPEPTSDEER